MNVFGRNRRDPVVAEDRIRTTDQWIATQFNGRLFWARLLDARKWAENAAYWDTQVLIAGNNCDVRGMGEAVLARDQARREHERAWKLVGEAAA